LRWMVRGPDGVDLGLWRNVSPARLIVPLDTHVARIARWLGLTSRRTIDWAAAEEITASLRLLDPTDPVKYDFPLCHWGMSGACPAVPQRENCHACPMHSVCREGIRWGVRRPGRRGSRGAEGRRSPSAHNPSV